MTDKSTNDSGANDSGTKQKLLFELCSAMCEGNLDAQGAARLEALVDGDETIRRQYCLYMQMHALAERSIDSLVPEEAAVDASGGPTPPAGDVAGPKRRPTWRWVGFTLTMVVLVAVTVGAYFMFRPRGAAELIAHIEQVKGSVELAADQETVAANRGAEVRPGMSVATAANSLARLRYPDGTTIDLSPATKITLVQTRPSKQLNVVRGGVFLDVAPQPPDAPLVLNPGRFDKVQVLGTRLQFSRNGTARVRVASGSVIFGRGENAIKVHANHESSASAETPPAPPAPFDSAELWPGIGRGLSATYFENPDLTAPVVRRVDPAIDLVWVVKSEERLAPPAGREDRNFSARWVGHLWVDETGFHSFRVRCNGGARLWIDNELLIDSWKNGHQELIQQKMLAGGRRHKIKLEYAHRANTQKTWIHLLWARRGEKHRAVSPESFLYPMEPAEE